MAVKTYDPKSLSIIVGGHIVSGLDDGEFVKVTRNNDAYTTKVGADGEASRTKNNDKSGTIEITLLQSSASNDVLSGFALADEINNGGQVPVLMRDANGTTVVATDSAWVKKMPDLSMGKELGNRTWVLECGSMDIFVGGNG